MKTIVVLEIEHRKELPVLANMIAGRAYTVEGVTDARVLSSPNIPSSNEGGFTLRELSLGAGEVVSL